VARVTDPADRLEIVRPAVPVDLAGAVLGESWSNDTWLTDRSVLRVCWRGDRERLVRERMLLAWLEEQPGMDRHLAGRVRTRIAELGPLVSDAEFDDGVVVHGDAHLANVLWYEGRLAALLDLEWARLGPRDLEFEAICRDDADIQARVSANPVPASEVPVLAGLCAGYPELFDREHLTDRVWLYDICFQVRQLCLWKTLDPRSLQNLASLTARPKVRFR
jgi:hypothetical protein